MTHPKTSPSLTEWKPLEKWGFRVFSVYFILQAFPLDWKYYGHLLSVNWFNPQFADIFNISRYTPQFFSQSTTHEFWGINTLGDWLLLLAVAIVAAILWAVYEQKRQWKLNYDDLYYYLRVILRYRLAIGAIAYGLIKFFPLQAPYPSLSSFNTNYGDLSAWKIFDLSLGVAHPYEATLGAVEIIGGLLLLYRKTTALGAFALIIFYGNVFFSNLAYEGGEAIYSLYLLHIAGFLLLYDLPRLLNLLSLNKPAQPDLYKPSYSHPWQINLRRVLKTVFIFFFVFLFGYKTYAVHQSGPYLYPKTPGLANASGLYNVSQFSINGAQHPYYKTDTLRWQDVVLEKWSTLSIKTAGTIKPWLEGVEIVHKNDKDRLFETAGTLERKYYHYTIDSQNHVLNLENKNPYYATDKFQLHYERPNDHTLILSGVTSRGDSVSAVLDRLDKKYLFEEAAKSGRGRGGLKL